MNKIKKTGLLAILLIFSILAIGIAGGATFVKDSQINNKLVRVKSVNKIQPQLFDAEITFYIWEGDGCACEPIEGATIFATGGESNDSGVTDADGKCVLTLVENSEYRVSIEADKFHRVKFDFEVIGDQTFNFHMKENKVNSFNSQPLFYEFISKIFRYILR